jgi:integrase/recombinase XerD
MPSDAKTQPAAPTAIERERDRYLRYVTLERGRSPHTVAAYRGDLARYLEFLGSRGLITPDQVTPDDLRSFVDSLEGAASTVARKLSSIKNFHRFLLAEGVVVTDPSSPLPSPARATRLPKALTVDQVGRLLDSVIGDDSHALRDRALLEFLYATGARISEALGLSVDDVLGDDGRVSEVIRVTGKGQKQRIVPVGSYARAAMDSYLTRSRPSLVRGQKKATPAVFLGLRGAELSRQNAWLIVQSAANRAGLEGLVSPHTLRHSFATHVLSGGADIRVVQELLGHASVATTQIYTKVTIDTLREVYQGAHPRAR